MNAETSWPRAGPLSSAPSSALRRAGPQAHGHLLVRILPAVTLSTSCSVTGAHSPIWAERGLPGGVLAALQGQHDRGESTDGPRHPQPAPWPSAAPTSGPWPPEPGWTGLGPHPLQSRRHPRPGGGSPTPAGTPSPAPSPDLRGAEREGERGESAGAGGLARGREMQMVFILLSFKC